MADHCAAYRAECECIFNIQTRWYIFGRSRELIGQRVTRTDAQWATHWNRKADGEHRGTAWPRKSERDICIVGNERDNDRPAIVRLRSRRYANVIRSRIKFVASWNLARIQRLVLLGCDHMLRRFKARYVRIENYGLWTCQSFLSYCGVIIIPWSI